MHAVPPSQVWVPGSAGAAHIARAALASDSPDAGSDAASPLAAAREQLQTVAEHGSDARSAGHRTVSTGTAAGLSPQLTANLGLGCHLQPLLRAAGSLPLQQRQLGAEVVALQMYAAAPEHRLSVSVTVPGRPPVCVRAATAISITTVAMPEATLLPTEESLAQQQQQQQLGGASGCDPAHGMPSPAGGAAAAAGAAAEDVSAHDEAALDALQGALERFFQSSARLLCRGDVFCLTVPVTDSLYGALATLHGGGNSGGSSGEASGKEFVGGGNRPVYFQVVELSPGARRLLP